VIVTAFSEEEDKLESKKCGADAHLNKPVLLRELRLVLKSINIDEMTLLN
jgi:DNA-binding response OmpR family regulator